LYRALTVEEHLRLAGLERPSFDASASRRYLSELRVPLGAKGGELSGGQRAQLTLAIALGTHARVLLLDEPLASLDPLARRDFLAILSRAVAEAGTVAVLASHVVTDIEQSCDRLIVLGQGRVLVEGPIGELVRAHRVRTVGDAGRPGDVPVTAFAARQGAATLVRVDDDVPASSLRDDATSLEDIVVGYLTLGRDQ
jgi:ABC-2 type transport system ATP-binding protein